MIYLNNAATGYPKPPAVLKAVAEYLTSVPYHGDRVGIEKQREDPVAACRQKLAALFDVDDPARIVFTSGSTESLNLAIYGMDLAGGHVITTGIEHNSVLRPLKTLAREQTVALTIVACDQRGYVDPEAIASHLRPNTRAVVVNHCSNVTGSVLDLAAIAEITGPRGVTLLVDASQSAGCLPISGRKLDMIAFTGHKALHGMPGIGGLYIREGLALKPLKVGGTGVRSELLYQPEDLPLYYEAGTRNLPGIISLKAGLEFIEEVGLATVAARKQALIARVYEAFSAMPEVIMYGSAADGRHAPIISFNIRGVSPKDSGYILEESFDIIVRSGLHCAPLIHKSLGSYPEGSLRVSPSYFTTVEEIEAFIAAVAQIVAMNR